MSIGYLLILLAILNVSMGFRALSLYHGAPARIRRRLRTFSLVMDAVSSISLFMLVALWWAYMDETPATFQQMLAALAIFTAATQFVAGSLLMTQLPQPEPAR